MRRSAVTLLYAIFLTFILMLNVGCAKTAAAQWSEQRSLLTAVQDSSLEANKAGLISDSTFKKIVPIAQAAQRLLTKAEAELPRLADGSIDYDAKNESPSLKELLRTVREFIEDMKALRNQREPTHVRPSDIIRSDPDSHQSRRAMARSWPGDAQAREGGRPDQRERLRAYQATRWRLGCGVQRVCFG